MKHLSSLLASVLMLWASCPPATAQAFLNLQESPASSGLYVDSVSSSYPATGFASGTSYLFNAADGDHVSVILQTTLKIGSSPRIRISDAGGTNLVEQVGDHGGRCALENFRVPSPGVYTLTIFSNDAPSPFNGRFLLGRDMTLETETNSLPGAADVASATPAGGAFTLRFAGVLEGQSDWIDLGDLAAGSNLSVSIQPPAGSSLTPADLELALFQGDSTTPTTSTSGGSLAFAVTSTGRYRLRMQISGVSGTHLRFDGTGGSVNLGTPAPLQITGDQTIEFWVRPDRLGVRQNPYEKAYGGEGTMTIETGGDINYFYGSNGGNGNPYQTINSLARLRQDEWTHVALVRDLSSASKTVKWYFNGQLVSDTAATIFPAAAGSRDFLLGSGYAGIFTGALDDFRVWNVARSAAQVAANYKTTLAGTEPGLVAYYKFEEGSGTTVTDLTTNALTGTLSGGVTWDGNPGADPAKFAALSETSTYYFSATVTDSTPPTVVSTDLYPLTGHLFDGTSFAPTNMTAERGNNGSEYLYTVTGTTAGTLKGTDLYTDDSSIGRAAVHAGILLPGEPGAVKVTVLPGSRFYQASTRNGTSSSFSVEHPGSFRIERYIPAVPFTLDGIFHRLWVRFSEPMQEASVASGVTLLSAGSNGTLGDSDDVPFALTLVSISDDNRAVFDLGGKILQAGLYRLAVAATVQDRADNTLSSPFTLDFTVVAADGYTNEDGDNEGLGTADNLSLNVESTVWDNSFVDPGINQSSVFDAPFQIVSTDFDGDGNLDAAVGYGGSGDRVAIFPGNGDGTFATPLDFPSNGGDIWDVALIDLNADGLTDLVATARTSDRLLVLHNTSTPGALSFVQNPDVPVGDDPLAIAIADFDGLNGPDVAVSCYGTNGTTGRCITILLNDGAGGFTTTTLLQGTVRAYGLAADDFDGDGNPDLAVGDIDNTGRIGVLLGVGDGTFGAPAFYDFPSGWDPSAIVVADFNQDGHKDLGVTRAQYYSRDFSIYPGVGDGTFLDRVNIDTGRGYHVHFAKAGDFTGDGFPDLLIGGLDTLSLLQNRADGTFAFNSPVNQFSGNSYTYAAAIGDFDGDSLPDLLATDQNDDRLRLVRGNPRALLAADDSNPLTALLHGFGRGFITNASDYDFFSFTAQAGQRLHLAVDTTALSGARLNYGLYDSSGTLQFDIYGDDATSNGYLVPRDGTYYIRVGQWYGDYNSEYRFRLTLAPVGSGQQESEDNNAISQSDPLSLTLAGNQLTGRIYGMFDPRDSAGDYFQLGNLAAGTEVRVTLDLPSTTTLTTTTLTLFKANGTAITPDTLSPTELIYVLQPGDESTYHLRVTGAPLGILSEYFANIALTDLVAPTITGDSLPAEAGTLSFYGSAFSLNYSEDMLASTVTDPANYELLGSGGDGTFGDGNEVPYTVAPGAYSSGLSQSFSITDGPLQPDSYRFTASTSLRDKLNNPLASPYVRTWTLTDVPGYTTEDRENGSLGTADNLSFNVESTVWDNSFVDAGTNQSSVFDAPFQIVSTDFDGDGNLDAAVGYGGSGDRVAIFPGNGDGTFATPLDFPSNGGDIWDVALIDLNADGLTDLVATARTSDRLLVLHNTSTPGALSFVQNPDVPVGDDPLAIAIADFDGLNGPDVAVSCYGTNGTTGRCITILLNDGAGGFTTTTLLQGTVRAYGLAADDFNGDGNPDLAVGDIDNTGRIGVLLGVGDGTFGAPAFYDFPSGWDPSAIVVADFNQDGHKDLGVTRAQYYSRDFSIYPGVGDGSFLDRVNIDTGRGYHVHFAKVGDYTGDGWPDLLLGGLDTLSLLQNSADGTLGFKPPLNQFSGNSYTYAATFGDFDGDSLPDLLATDQNDDRLRLVRGNPRSLLAADDSNPLTALLHGFGRGFITNASDYDFFSFSAKAGQRLHLAVDTTALSGARLNYGLYDSSGTLQFDIYGDDATSNGYLVPRDGTYYIRVGQWYGDYNSEYRFRLTLAPVGSGQQESEDNNAISQSDPLSLTLAGNQLTGRIYGMFDPRDSAGDYFQLGNLAAGTEVRVTLDLPSTTTLTTTTLTLFKANGTAITPDTLSPTELIYVLQPGDESTYHLRVTGAPLGILSEYFANIALTDLVAPTITGDSLPAEAGTLSFYGSTFSLNYSEDMLASTVTDPANYELLGSGGDGTFGDGNEVPYTVAPGAYSSGLSQSFSITDGPLQPDSYRFTASTSLRDKLNNPLASPYVRTWTLTGVPGYTTEDRENGSLGTADNLSFNVESTVWDNSFVDAGTNQSSVFDAPFQIVSTDFDGDGNLDAAVGYGGSGDRVAIFPGNGDGTFATPLDFPSNGGDIWDVALIDLNADGLTDLVATARTSDRLLVLHNTSTPGALSFVQNPDVPVGDDPLAIAIADFDGLNGPDVAVSCYGTNGTTGRCITILLNDGAGGFTTTTLLQGTVRAYGLAADDFDGDGNPDLAVGDIDNTGRIGVLLGVGDGTFGAPAFYDFPSGWDPSAIVVADFNQDGHKDLGVTRAQYYSRDFSIYPGVGDGTFLDRVNIDTGRGYHVHFAKVGDYTGDGWPDLLLGGLDTLSLLQNSADGTLGFKPPLNQFSGNSYTYAATFGDFDGDSLPDLLATDQNDDRLRLVRGNPQALLAADDSNPATALLHGFGRGYLTNASDYDFFSFSAKAGQRLHLAADTTGLSGARLNYGLYDSSGTLQFDIYGDDATSNGYLVPRDGTYYIRVGQWYGDYNSEYRFRLTLAPVGSGQQESEDNNAISQSDPLSLTLSGNQLTGRIYGMFDPRDSAGDYFQLGNLAAGTEVRVTLNLPSTTTLTTTALTLFKANGSAITPDTLSPTELIYVLQPGDDSTYHLRVTGSPLGVLSEYFANISITDLIPPSVIADTLPTGSGGDLVTGFSLQFNKDMLASTINDNANYSLAWAGPDNTFATADDEVFGIVPTAYSSGLSNSYSITNAPLPPGDYQFRVIGLRDKFGNTIPVAYTKSFSITGPGGYQTEDEPNQTDPQATPLTLDTTIPGYTVGNGRGVLRDSPDIDYWSFEATAGDLLLFEAIVPAAPGGQGLNYRLIAPGGGQIWDRYQGNSALETLPPTALTETGRYILRIDDWYGLRTEYRFRVALVADPVLLETEPNNTIATANLLSFQQVNGIDTSSVAGLISNPTALDYFSLGTVPAGTTVFLSVRKPAGSTLNPIVSLYSSSGVLVNEVSGSPNDDSAELQIGSTGVYIALIRGNIGSSGLNGDYVLDVRTLPTNEVNFPNLRVTSLDDITAAGLRTGDPLTVNYEVTNSGSLGTGTGNWFDRIVLSTNDIYGDGDDLQLAVVPHTGVLAPSESYTVSQPVRLPDGLPGNFHLIVFTDSGNAVDEILQEGDNSRATSAPFNVQLQNYPDLVIENLAITGPDPGGNYNIDWNLANRGTGAAPAGHAVRLQVLNTTTAQLLTNVKIDVTQPLAVDELLPQGRTITTTTPGYYLITVTADTDTMVYEYGPGGHGQAEANSIQNNFQIFRFYNITVAASPPQGGSVGGGGSIREGVEVTVTAVPDTSTLPYRFINWTENGLFASASATYSFNASANRNLVAVFALPQYQILASPSPSFAGSVAGTGSYALNSAAQLTANPAPGYLFQNWVENSASIGSNNPLSFTVNGSRSFTAVFIEANPEHVVTLGTTPSGLAVIPGGGTYTNGQVLNTSAPSSIEQGDSEFLFEKFLLNGQHLNTNRVLSKTFSTLDPPNIAYTAVYKQRSLRPVIIAANSNYGTLLPAANNVTFTVTFDRDMNTSVAPTFTLSSATAGTIPTVPPGVWSTNRKYVTGPTVFTTDSAGAFTLTVTNATDTNARVMDPDASFGFTVDVLPPDSPLLTLGTMTSSTANVTWTGYAAPADLAGFRFYLATSNFTTVTGLVPVNAAGKTARSFTFTGLVPDQDYFVAAVAVDLAGNANPVANTLTFRLQTVLPPAVSPVLERTGIASARVNWNSYDRSIIGLQGFRIYKSTTPFTTVAGMTPLAELGVNTTQYLFDNLDRTLSHYIAVVAYNRNAEQIDAVTPLVWTDPLSGTLTENFTIGGTGQFIPIHQPLTLSGGAVLVIQPGTTLSFAAGTSLTVANGRLDATGTALLPIHFTSAKEFAAPPSAARGDWNGLLLADPALQSVLRHVWVRFGSGVDVSAGTPDLANLYAVQNNGPGLLVRGTSSVAAANCLLTFNTTGAETRDTAGLTLSNSVLKNNNTANAVAGASSTLAANSCWWGSPTPSGLQGAVSAGTPLANEPVLGGALAVKNGLTQTPQRAITLVVMSANGVGFRFSENSAFPTAIFDNLYAADDAFRFSPYGFQLPFTLSTGGGLKTVFAQLRSETDTPSATLQTSITLVTSGPVVNTFSLQEGQIVRRPLTVTATATAALGIQFVDFVVNGVQLARNTASPLSFPWDPRALTPGIARAEIVVRDLQGNESRRAVNVVVQPGAPTQPTITSPANNSITNSSPITVTGTAEPGIALNLKRNGEVVAGSFTAAANGTFSAANIPLVEGTNTLVVTATDFLGSSPSLPRVLTLDSGPPSAPLLLTTTRRNGRTFLEWAYQGTEIPTGYRVYWNPTSFSNPSAASNSSPLQTLTSGDFTLGDGSWFIGVAAFDAAGNRSAISNLFQVLVDFSPPALTVQFDRANAVGPGLLGLQVESSEPLASVPTLTIRPAGASNPLAVTLTQQTPTLFTGSYLVSTASSKTGTASLRASAVDLAGNVFNGVPAGSPLIFDVTKPTATVTTDGTPPIQTSSPVSLSVGLTLSEPLAPGTQPQLRFEPPVGSIVPIALTGTGLSWSGQINLNAAMGSGEGFFRFTGTDPAGNDGTVITSGEILELYNTSTPPPPGQVTSISGQILPGGQIQINWTAATRAESYKLYREPGSAGGVPTLLVEAGITGLTYTDIPPADGLYRYAVVSSLRGVSGPPSGVLVAESDRLPPGQPTALSVQLAASGVEISFAAPASGDIPSKYHVYRGSTRIRTLTTPAAVRDYPPRGIHEYRVASADQYGNENPTDPVIVELLVSPVQNLHLHARKGSAYSLTWQNTDGTVTGYNLYRDGVKQNGAPLPQPVYVDGLGGSGRRVTYEVTALNAAGNESPRRQVLVSPVDLTTLLNPTSIGTEGRSFTGYFDRLRLGITNRATAGDLAIQSLIVNRTVSGQDDISQTIPVDLQLAPGATSQQDLVIAAPLTEFAIQTFQLIMEGSTDAGGSRITYEFNFTKNAAVAPGNRASLRTPDVPVAGAVTNVELTLQNLGGAPMDIVLGRNGGAEPGELSIVVLDPNGVVVSRQPYNGSGAPNLILRPDGTLIARIGAGQSYTVSVPGVLIPEFLGPLGQGATLSFELAGLYSSYGGTNQVTQQNLIRASIFTNLIETPYYGTLVTNKNTYANEEDILISGQAINRSTGLPEPDAPLRIGFGVRGFVFYAETTTDPNGDFSYSYRPPRGFAGKLNLWAAHPLIVDQLNQKTIEYRRLFVVPGAGTIVMSKNDTLDFSLDIANPADLPVQDIQLSFRTYTSVGGTETDIDKVSFQILTPGPINIDPFAVKKIQLRATAAIDAPDDALATLSMVSAEGASADFRAVLSLRPAVPVLSFVSPAVGYLDMSVNRGQSTSRQVRLENKGLRPVEGVEVIPPQNIPWMDTSLPRNSAGRILLPDIPIGGSLTFDVAYAVPDGTPLGLYNDTMLIRGSNLQSDFPVNLFAQVTSSERGNLHFFVDNIFAEAVPNAKIRLRNPNLRQELGPFYTDSLGEVTIPDLQEGGWSYQIIASGHTSATGAVDVTPGQTEFVTYRLSKSLVTVEFSVTPVPFTDRYEITIEQTFETRVPVPVLIFDPPSTQLRDLPDVAEGTVLVNLTNVGLASVFEVLVEGQSTPYGSLIPLISYLPELRAQETVEIPFKWTWDVRSLVGGGGGGASPSDLGSEEGIERLLKRRELAGKMSDALSYPETGNAATDICAGIFLNPLPDPRGLAALTEGLACCPDGAGMATGATYLLIGYSVGGFLTGIPNAIASFIGCVIGGNIGGFFGGSGSGGGGSGGAPSGGGTFGPGGNGCFVAGTLVDLANGTQLPIEQIQPGQMIRTGESLRSYAEVESMITRDADDLHHLTLRPFLFGSAAEEITLVGTADHYVWTDESGWTRIDKLQVGNNLIYHDGRLYTVVATKPLEGSQPVYTLQIKDDGVFYANGLLVQHLCGRYLEGMKPAEAPVPAVSKTETVSTPNP